MQIIKFGAKNFFTFFIDINKYISFSIINLLFFNSFLLNILYFINFPTDMAVEIIEGKAITFNLQFTIPLWSRI